MTSLASTATKGGVIRVVLVDDHPVMRAGIAALLAGGGGFVLAGEHGDAESALAALDRELPDIVVLDHQMPGMSGLQALQALRHRDPSCRVVMLTSFPSDANLLAAMTAGASGFLAKGAHPRVIREALESVAAGGTYLDPSLAGRVVEAALAGRRTSGPFGMSVQQRRVVQELVEGRTNGEIGRRLGVSGNTVKTHVGQVLRKLGADNRGEAAEVARLWGLTS